MTDRYELYDKYNHNEIIRDNYTVIDGCVQIYSVETVVDLLNELHEENQQLKDTNTRCCNEYSYFHKQMMKLEKENENLKQALWEAEASYYAERSEYDFEYEEWIEELKKDWDREYWND